MIDRNLPIVGSLYKLPGKTENYKVDAFIPEGTLVKLTNEVASAAATLATDVIYGIAGNCRGADSITGELYQEIIVQGQALSLTNPSTNTASGSRVSLVGTKDAQKADGTPVSAFIVEVG